MRQFLTLLCLLAAHCLTAQTQFLKGTFAESQAIAQREKKPIFVFFTASWCGPCQQMKRNVFTQDSVGKYLQQEFVLHYADTDSADARALSQRLEINLLPTMMVFSPEGELLYGFCGYHEAGGLLEKARRSKDPQYQLRAIRLAYERDTASAEALRTYLTALQDAGLRQQAEGMLDKLLARPVSELTDEKTFDLIQQLAWAPTTNGYLFVLKHRAEFTKAFGEQAIEFFIDGGLRGSIGAALEQNNEAAAQKWVDFAKANLSATDAALFAQMKQAHKTIKDPSKDLKTWDKYINNCVKRWPYEANAAAWAVYEKSDSKTALKTALGWSEKSVAAATMPFYKISHLDTQAHLLYKLKRYADAQKIVDEAIAECTRANLPPPQETLDLQTELAKKVKR